MKKITLVSALFAAAALWSADPVPLMEVPASASWCWSRPELLENFAFTNSDNVARVEIKKTGDGAPAYQLYFTLPKKLGEGRYRAEFTAKASQVVQCMARCSIGEAPWTAFAAVGMDLLKPDTEKKIVIPFTISPKVATQPQRIPFLAIGALKAGTVLEIRNVKIFEVKSEE